MDSLPYSLKKAVAAPTEFVYPAGGGPVEVERAWILPVVITPELIATAEAHIAPYEAALRPAGPDAIRKWLVTLGTLCAGKTSIEDASVKVRAYVGLLDVPVCALTRESLIEAGRKFTWFPSFAEVEAFLTEKASFKRRMLARHKAIVEAKPSLPAPDPGKRWSELTSAEREQFEAAVARAKASLTGSTVSQQRTIQDGAKPIGQGARDLIARGLRPVDSAEFSGIEEGRLKRGIG
jgi:hypothetical protein